jgi:hypothetical protein
MYRNGKMVADQIFPELPVDKQSNKYFTYGLDNLRVDDDTRRPGAMSNKIDWNLSPNPYYCDGHALHSPIPDEWRENADQAINLDTDITIALTDKILLNREAALAAAIAAGCTNNDLAATKFDDDTKDPVKLIDSYKETIATAIGQKPNSLLLSRPVFRGIRNNALVKQRVSGALNGMGASLVTAEALATVLEVDNLYIGEAVKVTSNEGQAAVSSYVWDKTALLFYKPPSPGLRTVSLGYTFRWNVGRLGAEVYKGRLPDLEHSDYVEAMRYYDLRIIAAAAGYYMINCVA